MMQSYLRLLKLSLLGGLLLPIIIVDCTLVLKGESRWSGLLLPSLLAVAAAGAIYAVAALLIRRSLGWLTRFSEAQVDFLERIPPAMWTWPSSVRPRPVCSWNWP